jgi:high-affinity nickel permease
MKEFIGGACLMAGTALSGVAAALGFVYALGLIAEQLAWLAQTYGPLAAIVATAIPGTLLLGAFRILNAPQ